MALYPKGHYNEYHYNEGTQVAQYVIKALATDLEVLGLRRMSFQSRLVGCFGSKGPLRQYFSLY